MPQEVFPFFPEDVEKEAKVTQLLFEIQQELYRALRLYPSQNSLHGAHSVLREEFEELWEEIRKKTPNLETTKEEAIQVAAMALRLILEHCNGTNQENQPEA